MTRTSLLVASLACVVGLGVGRAEAVQLTAAWVDNSNGVATTRLERRLASAEAFAAVADVPPGVTEYVDASISAGTEYCYRALAWDADGTSPYSDESCATSAVEESPLSVAVGKDGTGTGTVTSIPEGILCGGTCSAAYPAGSVVTLIATPARGSTFAGWNGGCAGADACTIAGNAPVAVTATFSAATRSVAVGKAGDVSGIVVSFPGGIACGTACFATYSVGVRVTLVAIAPPGSVFAGWSGGCTGTDHCTLAGDASVSVTAAFASVTQSVAIAKAPGTHADSTCDTGCSETAWSPRPSP
jgi:hypothetical protein